MPRSETSAGVNKSTAAATATIEKPIVTDANDPATIEQNNVSGPVFPGDMPADIAALFAGTNIDFNAPVTNAQRNQQAARKGRAAKSLPEREVKLLTTALKSITGDDFDKPDAPNTLLVYPKHEAYPALKAQVESWVKTNNISGIAVKASFAKHRQSPVGYDPKSATENRGKSMLYFVTLSREEVKVKAEESKEEVPAPKSE